jgi:hypothetical protein
MARKQYPGVAGSTQASRRDKPGPTLLPNPGRIDCRLMESRKSKHPCRE